MAPKSILKNKSAGGAGASKPAQAGGKPTAASKDVGRNTKINAGSKFQKSLAVQQTKRPAAGAAGTAGEKGKGKGKGKVVEREESEDESSDGFGEGDVDMNGEEGGEEEADTDEEIARGPGGEKKKGIKRKRTATTAETFGSTLTALLSESSTKPKKAKKPTTTSTSTSADADAAEVDQKKSSKPAKPAQTILSLSHSRLPPSRAAESLERKAKKHLRVLKEEKEDRARVRNVLEGWAAVPLEAGNGQNENGAEGGEGGKGGMAGVMVGGQEFEKGLRKTAQRGVIKLFNAILIAAKNAEQASAGTSLAERAGVKDESWKGGKKEKDNIMGRGGKEGFLTQESFLDLVRKG